MDERPLAAPTNAPHGESIGTSPRDDVAGGLLWMLLGIVILAACWRMDRLEAQDINPYTIPGLVPGLLGLGMIFFAAWMLARGWRNGGFHAVPYIVDERRVAYGRLALALALCIGYAVGLLGRMPFWLAASLFVSVSIFALRFTELRAKAQLVRGAVVAVAIGIGSGALVTFVFEKLFLVRLP
ncbi:MAG: tripartite tricarboxylate transporter TctB family protein [Methylobacteriaceae bacterium]|nr:tripartite tricarboxylate transporter TctB family protein [Methylobacteriaceae bacterium]